MMLCCSSRSPLAAAPPDTETLVTSAPRRTGAVERGDFRSGDRTNQSLAMACRGGSPPGPPSLEVESRWMEHSSVETGAAWRAISGTHQPVGTAGGGRANTVVCR